VSAPADFLDRVAEAIRAERLAVLDRLGTAPVLWLAVAPLWTRTAAERTGFPVPSVTEFVRRARDSGWCEFRGSLAAEAAGELRFWLPEEARRDVIDLLTSREGLRWLLDEAREVARRVTGLSNGVPEALWNWAGLIGEQTPSAALVDQVRVAVEADDLAAAQQLVAAGKALAPVLAGTAELALDRARRLLSLGTRRRADGRALGRYLDRPELSGAVDRLLDPEADQWALHLRGVGGVGKTMLIRYLASGRYAAEKNVAAIPITRADFDYINPDYPLRRPIQLLIELADELALHTAGASVADRELTRFHDLAKGVHESLSGIRDERPAPLANPRVLEAIDAFAAVLRSFPQVLLILDTCEELAKADSGDPAAPTVATTLAIIERIHDRAPSIRVLFSGRRPLPPRGYLDVREVSGFTVEEARRYLAMFSARPLAAGLADAMIRQSPVVDGPIPLPGELSGRVSPFDLALYLSWADEDPDLDVSRVERGSDAYIEGRIIGRLRHPDVVRALPALASAGRLRVATIAAFLGCDAAVLGSRLAEQEWIDAVGDPPAYVAARPALARRLRHYFADPERAAGFTAATIRLARELRQAARDTPLDGLDVDELLAALRLSESAEAARLWDEVGDRAAVSGRWNWLFNVSQRVRGESDEEKWPTAVALRATVLAAEAAARRRVTSLDSEAAWRSVATWAGSHPDAEAGQALSVRAALRLLCHAPEEERLWTTVRAGLEYTYRDPVRFVQLASSVVDATHQLLEAGQQRAAVRFAAEGHVDRLFEEVLWADPDAVLGRARAQVRAWWLVSLARLHADEDLQAATQNLSYAEELAARAADAAPEVGWPDWIEPEDLVSRVRIERGLIAPLDASTLTTWEQAAAANIATIDGERLAALCLRQRVWTGVPDRSAIERWDALDSYQPDRMPTCSAHDLAPPLWVMRAEAWLAAGRPEHALAVVDERRDQALATRADDVTVRLADAQTVRIVRRMRLDGHRALLARLSDLRDPDPSRVALRDSARRAMAVVHDEPPDVANGDTEDRPAGWHAWWQSQVGVPARVPSPAWEAGTAGTEFADDIELDLEEMRLLDHPAEPELRDQLAAWLARPRPKGQPARSADPHRAVRAALRRVALAGQPVIRGLPRSVPSRSLAELAFEEAELVALRLPAVARPLFLKAAEAYEAAGDPVGRLLALASHAALATTSGDEAAVRAALDDVSARQPEVAAALRRSGEDAGPWRCWAQTVQRVSSPVQALAGLGPGRVAGSPAVAEAHTPPTRPATLPAVRTRRRRRGPAVVAGLLLAGLTVAAVTVLLLSSSTQVVMYTGTLTPTPTHHHVGRPTSTSTSVFAGIPFHAAAGSEENQQDGNPFPFSPPVSATPSATLQPPSTQSVSASAEPTASPSLSSSPVSFTVTVVGVAALVVIILAGLIILAGAGITVWRLPRLTRLADRRGVGALRLSSLYFSASVHTGITADPDARVGRVLLQVGAQRVWPLVAATPVIWLVRLLRRRTPPPGYEGTFTYPAKEGGMVDPTSLTWASSVPRASRRWWNAGAGATRASIEVEGHLARSPLSWERFLSSGLGPDAAGHIAWTRYVSPKVAPFPERTSDQADFLAPSRWVLYLGVGYGPPAGPPRTIRVRHAIGRATSTSAGSRFEVDGVLLGADELTRGRPALVILQAEPSDDPDYARNPRTGLDDLPEKLELAAYLMETGTPAVLLLPALPESALEPVVGNIRRKYLTQRGGDPRTLRDELRQIVQCYSPAAVLDDFVLFVNASRYRFLDIREDGRE
jgi:hypothetical protein